MKPILFFLSLLISGLIYSQKPFQGTVIYELRATGANQILLLKVHFGHNQLKITSRELDIRDEIEKINNSLLIHLDSGNVFTISEEHQTYEKGRLFEKNAAPLQPIASTIAGYAVTPV